MSGDEFTITISERNLRRILGETVGHGSVCWIPQPSNAVFDTAEAARAIEIAFRKLQFPQVEQNVPNPEFCRHYDKCAGKSSCPRDPSCNE